VRAQEEPQTTTPGPCIARADTRRVARAHPSWYRPRNTPTNDTLSLAGRRVLVVGLGRWGGGLGVTRWLAEEGARVTVTDQAGPEVLAEPLAALADVEVALHLGRHDPHDLEEADLIVVNPAVNKKASAFFHTIVASGRPWTTEINLFCARCPAPVVGVTGTYGKSTTCAMLTGALDACVQAGQLPYRAVHLGGNIGRSLLPELRVIQPEDVVVLELSNAQLEDLPQIEWAPAVGVIINLSPQHLDRYNCYTEYVAAKLNIARDPHRLSRVVVGPLPPEAEALLGDILGSASERLVRIAPLSGPLPLHTPGSHNQANAAGVLAVCDLLDATREPAEAALRAFPGLPHRLQFTRELDGVRYYNDSKATAPTAALTGIAAFTEPLVVLVGGQDKGVALDAWAKELVRRSRVVICVGESGPRVASAVRAARGTAAEPPVHRVASLDAAVALAHAVAQPGDVVLLSPGAPSFDAYPNFEHRGEHFARLVRAL